MSHQRYPPYHNGNGYQSHYNHHHHQQPSYNQYSNNTHHQPPPPHYNGYNSSSNQSYSSSSSSNDHYRHSHRHSSRDRDRDRSRDRYENNRNRYDRDDRYPRRDRYDHHSQNRRNYNNNNRNNWNRNGPSNGGYNGYKRGFGGNGGGGIAKFSNGGAGRGKYEVSSIHTALLKSIQELSLDERGAKPLRVWIDTHTNSEYQEARFKRGAARQIMENGLRVNKSVKISDIPQSAQIKMQSNSDLWLEGIPKGQQDMQLTFKHTVETMTNCIRINDKSMTSHQYTFDIYTKQQENKENVDNEENMDQNKISVTDTDQKSEELQKNIENDPLQNMYKVDLSEFERREIFNKLRRQLRPIYPTNFDNKHIFSFKKKAPKDPVMIIRHKQYPQYVIKLERHFSTDPELECISSPNMNIPNKKQQKHSFNEIYKKCQTQFQEQGLNIINRERFKGANYSQLHQREDKYYSLRNLKSMEIWQQKGIDLQFPDLMCLNGYKSTVSYAKHCVTKTQLANKLITKYSIHDFIKTHGISKVNAFIKGKRAVTTYSNQIIELDGLDDSKNLDSTFKLHDGSSISFRDYYKTKRDYINNTTVKLLEDHEDALVIHHKYAGKGNNKRKIDTIYYLPQLLYVIVPVEQHTDQTKRRLRQKSHPQVAHIIDKAEEINRELSKINKTAPFTTEERCIKVKGYYLEPPLICFKTRNGENRVKATEFNGKIWRDVNGFWRNLTDLYRSKGGGDDTRGRQIEWAICFDRNGSRGDSNARQIVGKLNEFNRNRGFQRGLEPLADPDIVEMDYKDLARIRERLRRSRYSVCLFILPSNVTGCTLKVDITRHVLFYQEPTTSLTPNVSPMKSSKFHRNDRELNSMSMDLQFICDRTINKKAAVFNVFETLLLKSRRILYYLRPQLPSNVFNYHSLWMIGIKILRKKGGAHLVMLNCNRSPFVGTIKYITNHSSMISSDKDVIPQHMMYQLTKNLLKSAVKKVSASRGDEKLPLNIIVLRSSGGDGLLKTIVSKELAGFRQALSEFGKTHKDMVRKANNGSSKWRPGVIFSVFQENVADAFGVDNGRGGIVDSNRALVVNQEITSSRYFDLFLSLPTKQERQLYGRVIRLVTLNDEYNSGKTKDGRCDERLRSNAGLMSDYIGLVYSSIWSYALNIPFPKVPNYPAPIKFAEHYASWQYSILTDDDTNLNDLAIDLDNPKPKICPVIPENTTIDNHGNENKDVDMK